MNIRVLASLCLINTSLLTAATVNWDGGGDGTSWTDAANWVGDVLPADGDDVVIDVAANPVIQVANALTLRSLNSEEDITFAGNLTLTGGTSVIKATTFSARKITISGGATARFPTLTSLVHTTSLTVTLQIDGAGSSLEFPNVTSIQGPTGISRNLYLSALNGGRIDLPLATEVVSGAVTFTADGAGSLIDLDALTTFTGDLYYSNSGFHALNGGSILSPALTSIDAGDLTCDTPGNLDLDLITDLTGSGTITLTGGVHDLSDLTTFKAKFEISAGSVPLLTSLATIENASISVTGGAILNLPLVTALLHTENANNSFIADGAGSRLSFPNALSIQGPSGISDNFYFSALNGGRVDVPMATSVTSGAVIFTADGAGSLIDLDDLTSFTGRLYFADSGMRALNGGQLLTPALNTFHEGHIDCDTPGNINFGGLTSLTGGGTVALTGGVHDLSALTSFGAIMEIPLGSVPLLTSLSTLADASLFLSGGADLDLPLVTTLINSENANNTLQADGAGTRLAFPNVTTIQGANGISDNFYLSARNGGRLEIPKAIEVVSGAVSILADGTGSVVDLDDLVSFTGDLYFTDSGLRALNGGVLLTPSLNDVHDGHLSCDTPGNFDFSQLTTLTGSGRVTLSGGSHDLSALTTLATILEISGGPPPLLTGLTTLENGSIFLSGGEVLELPLITSLNNNENGNNTLQAEGAGTRLSFPNVTSIQGADGISDNFYLNALDGGRLEIPLATQVISGAVTFTADGTNSLIDLDELSSFNGDLYFTDSGLRALNGGQILTPVLETVHEGHLVCDTPGNLDLSQLTTYTGGATMTLTGGVHDLSSLTTLGAPLQITGGSVPVMTALDNIDGASIFVSGGAVVNLPLITSYTQTYSSDRYLQAEGAGSRLQLPNLTELTSNNSTARQLFVEGLNGGVVDLSAVTLVTNPAANANVLLFNADGDDSLVDLSSLMSIDPSDAQINETNNGIVFTPGLDNATLPDLHLLSLTPSTTTLIPGNTVSLTWSVENLGGVDFDGTRRDSIFLASDALGTNATRIANFNITGLLASGTSQSITREITVPNTGLNGTTYLLVRADEARGLIESNESNNEANTSALTLPATLTLKINREELNEQNGGTATGSLSRNGDTSAPLTAPLSASPTSQLTIPASVTFSAGQNTRSFTIVPIDDQIPDGDANVTITAQAPGFTSGQDSIIILDGSVPALAMSVDETAPTEGDTVTVTVTRNKTTGPLNVALTKSPASQATVTSPLVFADGEASKSTTLTIIDDDTAEQDALLRLVAGAPGHLGASVDLTIIDNDQPTLTLALNRSILSEAAGPGQLLATITRGTATSEALLIGISASTPGLFEPLGSTFIPANQTSVTVSLNPIDNDTVDGLRSLNLWAQAFEASSGQLLVESAQQPLDLTDDDGPSLTLEIAKRVLTEGSSATVTITRNVITAAPLSISLSHNGDARVSLPTGISIPANQAAVTVQLVTIDNATNDGTSNLELIAAATAYASGYSTVTLSDDARPELLVAQVNAIPEVNTNAVGTYHYRIDNQGNATAFGPIAVQAFLSSDQTLSSEDELLDEYLFSGNIPNGLYFERTGSFFAPRVGGDHYVIVRVDSLNAIDEILETNNTGVSNTVDVVTAYSATVDTTVNVAAAGTAVPLTGSATKLDGNPAAFELVNIHILVRETKRIISALTDSNGNFTATFNPLPGEAGSYTIGATHPGTPEVAVQDAFTLLGFQTDPSQLSLKLTSDDTPLAGSFTLKNLANVSQSGLTFTLLNLPAGLTATFTPAGGNTLASLAETEVAYSFTASPGVDAGNYNVDLQITGSEGGLRQIAVNLTVCQNTSQLQVNASPIKRGMINGQQSFVNFTVRNIGGAPTGPLKIALPALSWMSSAVVSPLPSLAPDEEAIISLQLCPPVDLPLGIYTGALVLKANDSSLTVPYQFRSLSLAEGNLTINCEDEYTYFASSKPPLAGASIVVKDSLSGSIAATGTSGVDGMATFSNLTEGYYEVTIKADKHATYRSTVFIEPGEENSLRAFLQRQTVEYLWTVVPTQIEDRYRIVIDTIFETNVPAPVVTIEPAYIDLTAFTEESTQVDITFTNHGLIAASNLKSVFSAGDNWEITSLTQDLGDLPAKSSLTVPVVFKDLLWNGTRTLGRAGSCPSHRGSWQYDCGNNTVTGGGGVRLDDGGGCGGGSANPVGGGGGGGGFVAGAGSGGKSSCDPCLAKALLECYIGYIPGSGFVMCPYGIASASNLVDAGQAGLTCACTVVELTVVADIVCNTVNCFIDILQCANAAGPGGIGARSSVASLPIFTEFEQAGRDMITFVDFQMVTFGAEEWRELIGTAEMNPLAISLTASLHPASESGLQISPAERAAALATDLGTSEPALVGNLIDRLNRTYSYYDMGIYEIEDLSAGMNDDFITRSAVETASAALVAAVDRSRANGFEDPFEAYVAQQDELFQFLTTGDGVCARVKLRLEQEAVMTRDAFDATLEMSNSDDLALEDLNVSIGITDANGVDQSALFGITGNGVANGSVAPGSSESWTWTIIPTAQAAPTQEVDYFIHGTVNYMQGDLLVEIPLAAQRITVQPTPSLTLKYFHQRDVFSDDPHTDIIEPSIPFSLGVMIENEGAGIARNLRITSAQPVIIENEKGLFIDFDIIASEVNGQSLSPSLTANFGDFQPGEIKIGRWLLTSSLQGLFTEYEASFEHLNSLDDDRLSLIQGVTIHETLHAVAAPGPFDDGLPDFLVNDVPDFADLPDAVHLSDGSVEPVTPLLSGSAPAPNALQLSVTLTTDTTGGWVYVRVPDPGDGNFRLTSVVRSDGRVLPIDVNAWATDRTFIGLGQKPIRENNLHLFDHDTTGSYTLTYVEVPPADTQAPSSSVEMLPLANSGFFSVDWSGSDDNAVSSYDIYLSENGGPFTLWLEKTNNSSTLFQGLFGNDYAFYSIARDAAGNIEPAKSTAEATTTVSLVNQAPTLTAIADVTLTEGQTFTHYASASDPDGPDSALRYSIAASDPGVTINEVSGRIRWNTTESHGGTVTAITVTATDGNASAASTSVTFNVTILDDNKAPVLAHLATTVLEIGEAFSTIAVGTDPDLPVQTLTYQIVSGAQSGMTLDANTGGFAWTPQDSHGGQSFEVLIEVSDNQSPPLTSRRSLLIEVLEDPGFPPVFDPVDALIWKTGSSYSLKIHAEDPEGAPVSFSADFTGLPGWLALENGAGEGDAILYWHTSDIPPGIYLVPITAATDRQSTTAMITIEIIDRASFVDYEGWATAYGLTGPARSPSAISKAAVPNQIAYALGIDPVGGISPAQHEPRATVIATGDSSSLCFQLPNGGRPDLRYEIQTSTDLMTWETIGIKEGTLPWNVEAVVTEDAISPNLAIIKVWHDEGTDDQTRRFFRLIAQTL
ncbi:CARDB domain-containing protein [Verrucomicrobiaceae bacterium 227]